MEDREIRPEPGRYDKKVRNKFELGKGPFVCHIE